MGGGWWVGEWWALLHGGRVDALCDEQGDEQEHHALTLDPQQRLEQHPSLQSALTSWQRRARWRARRRRGDGGRLLLHIFVLLVHG